MKKQTDEQKRRQEVIARENERLRLECEERDAKLREMAEEKKETAKRHIEEVENLRLAHQQEIYMLKRIMK